MARALALLLLLGACEDRRPAPLPPVNIDFRMDQRAERVEPLLLEADVPLRFETRYGRTQVASVAGATPGVRCTVSVQARTTAEAEAALEGFRIVQEKSEGGITVRLEGEPIPVDTAAGRVTLVATVDYRVLVPPGTAVAAKSDTGDIEASGKLGECLFETKFGTVTARNMEAARLSITTATGAIDLSDLTGELVTLRTDHGSMKLERIRGDISAASKTGAIAVKACASPNLALESEHGHVEARGILQRVALRTGSGRIHLTVEESSRVSAPGWTLLSEHGDIDLILRDAIRGTVEAESRHGQVEGTYHNGGEKIKLSTGTGSIRIR